MIQGYVANYTNDATHKMTYDGSSAITITYKLAHLTSPKDVYNVAGAGFIQATGVATSYGANKLNDSGGGLSAAKVGSVVENVNDGTYANVTVVDSDTQLTLSTDIFEDGDETYSVTSGAPMFEGSFNAITGGTVINADFDQWHPRVVSADLPVAGYIKFNFSDGTNDYETEWIAIEGMQEASLFMYCQEVDVGANVAFDAILQAS
jgi:hypothetical protein